jgi:hypothetical protein
MTEADKVTVKADENAVRSPSAATVRTLRREVDRLSTTLAANSGGHPSAAR